MTRRWNRWQVVLGGTAAIFLATLISLLMYGLAIPRQWYTGVYAGGWIGSGPDRYIAQPPFGPFTNLDVFTINLQSPGSHFYLLGSDPGGRDLLGLVAHGAVPSLELVAAVVAVRLLVGAAAGMAMGFGSRVARAVADSIGSWIIGFPYLALAIVVIQTLEPRGKLAAFVVGMSIVGWRDVALQVAERIEHVRSQSFAEAATSLGTNGFQFFRLHVIPFLRPLLTVEVPFQASAALVLLAELGYLQVFIGPVIRLSQSNENSLPLLVTPELGQMLANTRRYLLYHEMAPVLVPAIAVAALALGFELLGTALRGRWRFAR
jgi:peptide/nickel transport system permease protein